MMGGDIIETFLNEARDLLEQLEAALLDLEKRPNDRELVNTTFRALHTLKGSGGMFGPPAMAAFAHELENAFEKVRQDHAPVTPALVSLLLQSADQIRKLLFEADGDHSAESTRLAKALIAEVDGAPAAAGSAPVAAAPAQPAAAASPLPLTTTRSPAVRATAAVAAPTATTGSADKAANPAPAARTALALVSSNASNAPASGTVQSSARTANNGTPIASTPRVRSAATVRALPGSGLSTIARAARTRRALTPRTTA